MSRDRATYTERAHSSDSEDLEADTPALPVDYLTESPVPNRGEYTTLLHKAVDAARLIVFPSRGTFDMSAVQAALSSETTSEEEINDNAYYLR